MTKLSLIAAVLALASAEAMAATTTDDFVVSVTFTSSCTVTTAAADLAFTYTAFAASPAVKTTGTTFSCTRGLTPSFAFDDAANQTGSAAASATGTITGEGLIAGLRYTLSGTTTKTAGDPATAGAAGTGGTNGTADTYAVAITATIPANQAGDGATTTNTSQTRTLTITY